MLNYDKETSLQQEASDRQGLQSPGERTVHCLRQSVNCKGGEPGTIWPELMEQEHSVSLAKNNKRKSFGSQVLSVTPSIRRTREVSEVTQTPNEDGGNDREYVISCDGEVECLQKKPYQESTASAAYHYIRCMYV